jgi:hypothetical protein
MGTRIIQFGVVPDGILAALAGNGYEVDAWGTSLPKLKQALQQQNDLDAIAVAENGASKAAGILTSVRSLGKVPLILFQDESRTCDPSRFDLVIPEHAPLPDLLTRVAAVIERSRAIHAKQKYWASDFIPCYERQLLCTNNLSRLALSPSTHGRRSSAPQLSESAYLAF